jgi:D-alanyl-D-alanine carboxypeptidase
VNTISGYVTDRGGEKLVFSVMINNYAAPREDGSSSGRGESDKVVKMIADFGGRSDR